MKRRMALAAGVLALTAAVVLLWGRRVHENPSAPTGAPTPVRATQPFERPVSESEPLGGPRPLPPPSEQEPARPSSPLKVGFFPAGSGALGEPIGVDLVVEPQPDAWPAGWTGEAALEFLLRLPAGVQLRSEGWTPVDLPAEEKADSSGPWILFERKRTLDLPAGPPGEELARERIELAVVEKGTNWIVTTRARLSRGSESWQTFGVIFATVDPQGIVEFHPTPRLPAMEPRAEANRS